MLEKIKEILVEQLNCDADSINEDTSFKDDLGADSLDLYEMVMALEDEYRRTDRPFYRRRLYGIYETARRRGLKKSIAAGKSGRMVQLGRNAGLFSILNKWWKGTDKRIVPEKAEIRRKEK